MNMGLLLLGIVHVFFGLLILLFPKLLRILVGGYLVLVGIGYLISSI
ncbi:MAG: DUF3096 domain-containing protein [Candidatus Woesearchaeota archaeon]